MLALMSLGEAPEASASAMNCDTLSESRHAASSLSDTARLCGLPHALDSVLMSWKKLVFCGSDRRDRSTPLASVISDCGVGGISFGGGVPVFAASTGPPLPPGVPASGTDEQAGLQAERMRSSGAS